MFNNKSIVNRIFSLISSHEFNELALEIFRYQVQHNQIYRIFNEGLKADYHLIDHYQDIPFLPVGFFKTHRIISGNNIQQLVFKSSGTTGKLQSKHYVVDQKIYEMSFRKTFELFYGNIKDYCILALLPSYLERGDSSLIYMVNDLIKNTGNSESGFYLKNVDELILKLRKLSNNGQKTIMLGVSFALLDLVQRHQIKLPDNISVMETGGMKGRKKEMIREELHEILCLGLGVKKIHSEYGMTEILSQSYSLGNGKFRSPPWKKILIRDINDPLTLLPENHSGGINIIDLANIHSCSFIATQDVGRVNSDGSFEVLGRFDNSDIRGCNLML